MGGFRLVFGPFIHQEGLDEVIAYYGLFLIVEFLLFRLFLPAVDSFRIRRDAYLSHIFYCKAIYQPFYRFHCSH